MSPVEDTWLDGLAFFLVRSDRQFTSFTIQYGPNPLIHRLLRPRPPFFMRARFLVLELPSTSMSGGV
jgi:hypothetical protein